MININPEIRVFLIQKGQFSTKISIFSTSKKFKEKFTEYEKYNILGRKWIGFSCKALTEKSKEYGMNLYYDSLSESGMLEKNGHFVSFRTNESIILFDGTLMKLTDAPVLENNTVSVTKNFMDAAENFFQQEDLSIPFKVGAIVIDPGHGGKDPGALKTYKINGKNVTIQEKDINLKVPRGKIIGLLGKNGMGKTTLIKLINALCIITKHF